MKQENRVIYKFNFNYKGKKENVFCTLETTVDISPVIRNYRGGYVGKGKGYAGNRKKGIVYEDDYSQGSFEVYKWEGTTETDKIYPNESYYSRGCFSENERGGSIDIRRIIGDVLYSLYIGNIVEGKVQRIKIHDDEYVDIQDVRFIDENNDKRIIFNANNGQKILVPISLDSTKSELVSSSTIGLYTLEDKNENENIALKIWKQERVFLNDKEDGDVDLFYGEKGNRRGVFFYFNNKLEDLYTINFDDETIINDLKYVFYHNSLKGNNNLEKKIDLKYENFKNLLNDSTIRDKFVELINSFIAECWFSKDEGNKGYEIKRIEEPEEPYCYTTEIGDFTYEFTLTMHNSKKRIFFAECNELGKIKKNDICIKLADDIEKWIFETDKYKVYKKTLQGVDSNFSKQLTGLPAPKKANNDKVTIYTLDFIKKYIDDNKSELNDLFTGLENLSSEKIEILSENSITENNYLKSKIKELLYPASNIADENVVNEIYEAKVKYNDTDKAKLPNYAIMGGPGTGKSTLAKNIAKCLIGDDGDDKELILYKSTSDLKGAYVGHTGARMYDLIVKASKNKQIIFIDEAYSLQRDEFGKEALEICLPLMTGDRKYIEKPAVRNEPEQTYDFEKEGTKIPPIWFAGYETEMRKMLSENPGLYRRMKRISLQAPTVEGLYSCLLKKVASNDTVKKAFENCKNEIRNYFSWAISKENVDYFGNYAGVEDFKETCEIRLKNETDNKFIKRIIIEIIDEKKKEIKRQYKAILEHDETIEFEVQNDVDVVLEDVKGNEKIKNNLEDIVDMILNQKDYITDGIRLPKGALLVGPPGTGKTMLARAVAGEIQKGYRDKEEKNISFAFIATVATELNDTKKIKALFKTAEEYDSSIIFIDEIDAIGKERNMEGANPPLLIQLMKELDGFEERKNIFVMAATNAPGLLDPALKRPGRFDREIEVTYPDKTGREAILKSALTKLSLFNADTEEAQKLAQELVEKTIQYTPADLVNLVNEAAILYKKSNNDSEHRKKLLKDATNVTERQKFQADIFEMLERLKIGELNSTGKEKEFQSTDNIGCSAVAIHEVGHALVSVLLGLKPFERITIISRGNVLGYVSPSNKNELRTKKDFLNQIRVCLGGRVAEEVFYQDNISTGAVQDIQQATKLAKNMITLFGMSDTIGMMALQTNEKNYLGEDTKYICSDAFRYEADDAIRKLLAEQLSITRNMLESHKKEIESMAQYVFDEETVTGDDFFKKYQNIIKEKLTSK